MTAARRALPDVLAAGGIALAIWLFFGRSFLNYDSFYAVVWGEELLHGRAPDYGAELTPTPHPLATAVGGLLSFFGDAAEWLFVALVLLAVGALCVGLFRLGQELFGWPVGLLAAAIVATRVPILDFGVRGYVDLPAAALLVWAAVLEARRPRRGAPVLVLLAVAGLLRPEAWLFSAVYLVWLARGREWRPDVRLALLAAAAPLLWALSDLVVTGDPLWSLTGTNDLAGQLGRKTGLDAVPEALPRRLGEILRLPELVAAVAGFAAAFAWLRGRILLPAAVAALNGVTYLIFALAGLPLLGRYLFVAASMLALFAAVAAFGWRRVEDERVRGAWRLGGAVVLAGLLLFSFTQADRLGDLRDNIEARERVHHDLRDLVDSPASERALARCSRVYVSSAALIPSFAYWTGKRPGDVRSLRLEPPAPDSLTVSPASEEAKRLARLDPNAPGRDRTAATGPRVAENESWNLRGRCN